MASRPLVNITPSAAVSTPAAKATPLRRVSRRTDAATRPTTITPAISEAMRQPNGVKPNTRMPLAMSHLPSGGCLARPCSAAHWSVSTASVA